ncbi:Ig-like domain-containing protein [Pelagicoccus sp. SDUM812003]|uniref:Ig-like domain-containing protein n=1 Tax=Pelagicoccus sp. SDUM812003 TaxID=3041267 RepID=UPI00280C910A|nr:Ig-like domain-containing protein [Pelagicoccus sp. SDUM812003]MDQ8203356.1 Ig-like domain-containing protein [Pelagicoccus sp. SDUM812003]
MKSFVLSIVVLLLSANTFAAIVLQVPSSVDVGEQYQVSAYDPQGGPSGAPYVRLYKNGVLVGQGSGGTGLTTADNSAGTVTWRATSTMSSSVTKYTTVIATNTPPIGAFDSLTSSVTQGKTISATGWAADNEMGSPITRVDVFLNGVDVANATLGGVRNDVASAYGRSDYTNSGWSWSYNTSSLALGTHSVQVKFVDNQGAVTTKASKTFTVSSSVPTTTLSAADTTLYAGQTAQLTSVTTDPGSELTTHYMDYLAPGASSWTLYSPNWAASGNSYWSGSQRASHSMTVSKVLNIPGTWQFRSRGRDAAGRYSSYKTQNVVVYAAPTTSISSSQNSILVGDSVTLSAPSSDALSKLTQIYIDQKVPGGSWEVSKYYWSGSARSSYTFQKTFALANAGTWQFRARGRNSEGVYGPYSATISVQVADITMYSDFDNDGLPDWWEEAFWYMGLDPRNASDASADFDGDGVSNYNEFAQSSNDPLNKDPYSWFVSPPLQVPMPTGATLLIVEPDGDYRGVEMPALKVQ